MHIAGLLASLGFPHMDKNLHDNGTWMAVPVSGKRIKVSKKRHKDEPDLESMASDKDRIGADGEPEDEG